MFEPCEECVKKHLSAALARAVDLVTDNKGDMYIGIDSVYATVGRACVLYTEANHPEYAKHADLAYGLLIKAEEACVEGLDGHIDPSKLRSARYVTLISDKLRTLGEFLSGSYDLAMMAGHIAEARREGCDEIVSGYTPARFINEYESLVAGKSSGEEGGE